MPNKPEEIAHLDGFDIGDRVRVTSASTRPSLVGATGTIMRLALEDGQSKALVMFGTSVRYTLPLAWLRKVPGAG